MEEEKARASSRITHRKARYTSVHRSLVLSVSPDVREYSRSGGGGFASSTYTSREERHSMGFRCNERAGERKKKESERRRQGEVLRSASRSRGCGGKNAANREKRKKARRIGDGATADRFLEPLITLSR